MNTIMRQIVRRLWPLVLASVAVVGLSVNAQAFVHPGGLHNQADLDRMKAQVAAGAHPWIDGWNNLITDPRAQNTYTAAPSANMSSRQRAQEDATAMYYNALRWYITGDTSYATCAVNIANAWSSTVNATPAGDFLSAIPCGSFALAAEVLRIYPGWAAADVTRFKNMTLNYFYPKCNDYLLNHGGSCISNYWANWDDCNILAVLAIGVLCDDTPKYNQAVTYFQSGAGEGSIMHAVYFIHPGGLGQWQESGRDQEHGQLGVGLLGAVCEVAWKQGLDLYGYSSSRLLAGAEYTAQYNLWKSVPFTFYNNCQPANNKWVSINGRGRLDDRPVWELLYNHYVIRKGLSAPNTTAMARLMRPEHGSADHFGYGTLTFTLNASTYPPSPTPPAPSGLTATAGVGRVFLNWTRSGDTANGYEVRRSTTSGGSYTSVASWTDNTRCEHTDTGVTNGTTYYYVVAARNQSGTSGNSGQASATPAATGALPSGWTRTSIGTVTGAAADFANVNGGTYVVAGSGTIGGTADAVSYVNRSVTGDATLTVRISSLGGTVQKSGIMMRESTAADARTVSMTLGDAGWRFASMGTRSTVGGSMSFVLGNTYTWVPAWFRLARVGNVFTASESSDGVTWFTVGSTTIAMSGTYVAGMAISSGGTAVNDTTFDNVMVTGGGSGGAVPVGTYSLLNRASGKMLDNLGATADGAIVGQWADSNSNNQKWTLSYVGSNAKLTCVTGGKCLDSINHTADGSTVAQWTAGGSLNQQWTIQDLGTGYYKIINVANGKCLDTGGGTADGAQMQFWGSGSSNNQQWQFVTP